MDREDIIRMAREAGMPPIEITSNKPVLYPVPDAIERFAALVLANNPPQSSMAWQEGYAAGQAAEREACAKVCDGLADMHEKMNQWSQYKTAETLAQAIRARGETK